MVCRLLGRDNLLRSLVECSLLVRTFFFFFLTYRGLKLIPLMRKFYQLYWANFILQLLKGLPSCLWTHEGVLLWYRILLGIWLMVLTYWGIWWTNCDLWGSQWRCMVHEGKSFYFLHGSLRSLCWFYPRGGVLSTLWGKFSLQLLGRLLYALNPQGSPSMLMILTHWWICVGSTHDFHIKDLKFAHPKLRIKETQQKWLLS